MKNRSLSLSRKRNDTDPQILEEIADFWTYQLNNEIYLRNHPHVVRGSKEYFDIILSQREKYIYYFETMTTYLKGSPSSQLLEVGCGMGTDTIVFERNGFNVTGIDLTPAHITLAKRLFDIYNARGSFIQGNAERLPFPDNSFGSVYSFGVLHHTPKTQTAIKEIHRVLMPKGRAVIMLYNKRTLNNLAHIITRKGFENVKLGEDSPVTHRFSKADVIKMCKDFNACHVKTEYLFGAGWAKIYSYIPRPVFLVLSKLFGWHLVIFAQK